MTYFLHRCLCEYQSFYFLDFKEALYGETFSCGAAIWLDLWWKQNIFSGIEGQQWRRWSFLPAWWLWDSPPRLRPNPPELFCSVILLVQLCQPRSRIFFCLIRWDRIWPSQCWFIRRLLLCKECNWRKICTYMESKLWWSAPSAEGRRLTSPTGCCMATDQRLTNSDILRFGKKLHVSTSQDFHPLPVHFPSLLRVREVLAHIPRVLGCRAGQPCGQANRSSFPETS